jgi:hypothetical protein
MTTAPRNRAQPSKANIINAHEVFFIQEAVKSADPAAMNFQYREFDGVCSEVRKRLRMETADATIVFAAIDPNSAAQGRFVDALRHMGLTVEGVDYRHMLPWKPVAPAPPPPHAPIDEDDRDAPPPPPPPPPQRPSPNLWGPVCYLLGLLAQRANPEVLIVAHDYYTAHSLSDFVYRRNGRAAVLRFARYAHPAWNHKRGLDPDDRITLVDLDPFSERLLGVDINRLPGAPSATSGGRPGAGLGVF